MLQETRVTRYVTPLREGGSLPALAEAADLGTYVVKFTGAGQGRKALVAEVICGGLARLLGLRVPELVRIRLDEAIGRGEPDPEVQQLLLASTGLNLGMDYLPGSIGFDPLAFEVGAAEAGRVVWFDALVNNVDRSWRNPNLLVWHGNLWLIDHGAALIWHHNWPSAAAAAGRPFDASDHALAPFGPDLEAAAGELSPLVTPDLVDRALADVPDEWLADEPGFDGPDRVRDAYRAVLTERADGLHRRIVRGAPTTPRPSRAPEWLTGVLPVRGGDR
ncbi:HipA family kinase [Streptomyces sp. YIM 98790]|uniref:HipA family kinase n=1 Tax=Streptomyces sp. YIM 98790 TaxID=2689077 RepID=UPI00140E08F3|nr:HipA family kinase [Streptomyces sp. YIM 98790]